MAGSGASCSAHIGKWKWRQHLQWSIPTLVFLLSSPQSEGHGRGGGGCTFNGCFNARVPRCSCWNRKPEGFSYFFICPSLLLSSPGIQVCSPACASLCRCLRILLNSKPLTCLHPLASLGVLKMQGHFTSGSVSNSGLWVIFVALPVLVSWPGSPGSHVGGEILCLWLKTTLHLVLHLPKLWPLTPGTCNHHLNPLTRQILCPCVCNADWHKLWVVAGRYGLRPRKTHYSTELESSGWLSHDDI